MGNRSEESQGPGRLAQAIVDHEHSISYLEVAAVDLPENPTVLVYSRKTDGTLSNAVEYCNETETPLVFLSTGIDTSAINAENFPFIKVPNAALGVINYLTDIEKVAQEQYSGWDPQIVEHHQEAKADTSGTAKKLADMLGIDYTNIVSIRDFEKSQSEYGIPDASRDGYAVHSVTFTNPETGETSDAFEIIVKGRSVYAEGVLDIYSAIQSHPEAFNNGMHDIVTLVQSGIVRAHELKS
jgi:dihydrodipicolinate reductase